MTASIFGELWLQHLNDTISFSLLFLMNPYSVQFLLRLELCVQCLQPSWCSYLLGLLAMIKCSICSYQCDNWYVSNWRLDCHIYFWWGGAFLSLLRSPHVLHQNWLQLTLWGNKLTLIVNAANFWKPCSSCAPRLVVLSVCTIFICELTWLVLGEDPAARSHRVEQFTALWGL